MTEEIKETFELNKIKLMILFVGLFFYLGGWQSVDALEDDSLEKSYYDLGYKTVTEAVKDTETHYKKTLELPEKLPPLDFTHSFGRFISRNETLEIEYLNENDNYIINIIPARNGKNLNTDNEISLKDGSKAYYSTIGSDQETIFIFMVIKNDWKYVFSIKKSLIDDPISTFTEIANSIDEVK